MVADMSYTTTSSVVESWEAIKRIEHYREIAGVMLFEKLFILEPEAKTLFGFHEDTDLNELRKSRKFVTHASLFVGMFDKAVEMIGPDTDMLTDILLDLGEKHAAYGVKPEYFPSMGRSLIACMKKMLAEEFTPQIEQAWYELFGAMSYDMIRGQRRAKDSLRRITNTYQTTSSTNVQA